MKPMCASPGTGCICTGGWTLLAPHSTSYLSEKRDATAAQQFLSKVLAAGKPSSNT